MLTVLEKAGLKATQPRMTVLDILNCATQRHLSAYDIINALAKSNKRLSNSTVYRVLADLETHSIIKKWTFLGANSIYAINNNEPCQHFICKQCQIIIETNHIELAKLYSEVAHECGFEINSIEPCIYGYCNECTEKKQAKNN